MKVKDLCESERPREKLLSQGVSALSNGELLAVLLRSGSENEGALDLSQRILKTCGGRIDGLFSMSYAELCSFSGVGPAKVSVILAALELGRRYMLEKADAPKKSMVGGRSVFELMRPRLKGLKHEECWVLILDPMNRLQDTVRLTSGGFDSTVIDIRQTVCLAVERKAAGAILVHNHPSGDTQPSSADCRMTDLLRQALKTVGISLVDHVIVSDYSFFSFADGQVLFL